MASTPTPPPLPLGTGSSSGITLASAGRGPSSSSTLVLSPSSSSSSPSSPCAACKFLRRKCTQGCLFAPYFPPDQPNKFANVHKIFGASNVAKLLGNLSPLRRAEAVFSLAYEAEWRVSEPVYGCVGYISILNNQVHQLHDAVDAAKRELAVLRKTAGISARAYEQLYKQQLIGGSTRGGLPNGSPSNVVARPRSSTGQAPQPHLVQGSADHSRLQQQREVMDQNPRLTSTTEKDHQDLLNGYDLQDRNLHQQNESGSYMDGSGDASGSDYDFQVMEQLSRAVSDSVQQFPEMSNAFYPESLQELQILDAYTHRQQMNRGEQEGQDPRSIHHGHGARRKGSNCNGGGMLGLSS